MLEEVPHFIQFDFDCSTAMAKSVKLFQLLESVYESLGIQMAQPKLRGRVSFRCYIYSIVLIVSSIAAAVFFVSEGQSVGERGDAFYMIICVYSNILYIITYVGQAPEIRQLIGKFESFFQESKLPFCILQTQEFFVKKIFEISIRPNRVELCGDSRSIFRIAREN